MIEKALEDKSESKVKKSSAKKNIAGKRRTHSIRLCDSKGSTIKEQARRIGFYGVISDKDLMSYCIHKILGTKRIMLTFFFYVLYSIWTIIVNKWLGKWGKNELQFDNTI